jgi:protease-4
MAPEAAVAAGLVDALEYRDAIRQGKAGKERIKVRKYRAPEPSMFASPKVIAVVHAEGQIVSGESGSPVFGGSVVGDETVVDTLDDLSEDESVVAVVLRVNSPGGSGLASDNIWHAIERLQAEGKPVVTSMGDYAASGGYYIAAGTDHIVAEPSTITGSIGVFGGKMNVAGLYEKLGITTHTWKRGEQSGLLSPTSDFSEPERAKFRTYLESFYSTFLARVSEGRKMERDAVHAVAQGRVWTGRQALERGLVDGLGGLDTAIAKAEELAKLEEGVEVRVDRYPKRKTFLEQLAEDLQPEVSAPIELRLLPGGAELWAEALTLARVLDDGGVAAMLPMRLDVR